MTFITEADGLEDLIHDAVAKAHRSPTGRCVTQNGLWIVSARKGALRDYVHVYSACTGQPVEQEPWDFNMASDSEVERHITHWALNPAERPNLTNGKHARIVTWIVHNDEGAMPRHLGALTDAELIVTANVTLRLKEAA